MSEPKKPWQEEWQADGSAVIAPGYGGDPGGYSVDGYALAHFGIVYEHDDRDTGEDSPRASLAAAAPKMCRALLALEWVEIGDWVRCPCCNPNAERRHPSTNTPTNHCDGCALDAALTETGLDTREKRDAARAELEKQQ